MTQTYDPNQQPRHRVHFAPNEFALYIEHDENLTPRNIIGQIKERHNLFADIIPFDATQFDPDRVVTFNRGERRAEGQLQRFSLVFARVVEPERRDELEFLVLLAHINDKIRDLPYGQGAFRIRQATANWFSGGAPEPDGSGGPGSRPVPPDPATISTLQLNPVELPAELGLETTLAERGACANIFILDTAPCEVDLKRAYRKWVDEPLSNTNAQPDDTPYNRLLDNLIGPNGALGYIYDAPRIEYAGYSHLLELANTFLPDHDYVMSDHGLFVASIINRIAPAARLHLVEVLNPYGVGTLETITRGFERAANFALENTGAVVLVNASLFFEFPPTDTVLLELLAQEDPFWANVYESMADKIPLLIEPFEAVCNLLDQQLTRVIAAAGNDGKETVDGSGQVIQKHPDARYPARYDSVVGVAALNYAGDMAPYSNEADFPVSVGLAAFGGDKVGDLADPNRGVLGLYIGSFPNGAANKQGLARWSGTSFATPVVTGIFAALACGRIAPGDVLGYINSKLGNHRTSSGTTEVTDS